MLCNGFLVSIRITVLTYIYDILGISFYPLIISQLTSIHYAGNGVPSSTTQ